MINKKEELKENLEFLFDEYIQCVNEEDYTKFVKELITLFNIVDIKDLESIREILFSYEKNFYNCGPADGDEQLELDEEVKEELIDFAINNLKEGKLLNGVTIEWNSYNNGNFLLKL